MHASPSGETPNWFADPRPLVAVLAGGFGAERSISQASGRAVCKALAEAPWRPVYIDLLLPDPAESGSEGAGANVASFAAKPQWRVHPWIGFATEHGGTAGHEEQAQPILDIGRMMLMDAQDPQHQRRFEAAFVALHGSPGEDGWISGFLDMVGLPHTASGLRASAVSFDKELTKTVVAPSGMALANGVVVRRETGLQTARQRLAHLGYPLFVKPNRNGSSCGISRVEAPEALEEALEKGWAYGEDLLVESAISGREFTCAVYRQEGQLKTLPICEIVSGEGHAFFDYEAKYTPGEAEELIPAPIDDSLAESIRHWSMEAYRCLGLSGMARIDFIVDGSRCFFLEANTVPGLSEASIVPRMLTAAGIGHGVFYTQLLHEALVRR